MGTDTSAGRVYQLDDSGGVVGRVDMRYTAIGMAYHPKRGLVLAVPREGGKILCIDPNGKLATLLEKDPGMAHPVGVAAVGESDTLLVADNIADMLLAATIGGAKARVYHRFDGQKYTSQGMSVAVTKDKHVIFSSTGVPGVFRYGGGQSAAGDRPTLPISGSVAADPKSFRWAATQEPNLIYVYDGEQMLKKLRLPPGKGFYRNGLLCFTHTGGLCVAVQDSESENNMEVGLVLYDLDKDELRNLFAWQRGPMQSFVAAPRMPWPRPPAGPARKGAG